MLETIRLLHRVAVDWTADTFGLRGPGSARCRHDRARDRAHDRRHDRARDRAHALARRGPAVLHRPRRPTRPPRVLRSWQASIGRIAGHGQVRR